MVDANTEVLLEKYTMHNIQEEHIFTNNNDCIRQTMSLTIVVNEEC